MKKGQRIDLELYEKRKGFVARANIQLSSNYLFKKSFIHPFQLAHRKSREKKSDSTKPLSSLRRDLETPQKGLGELPWTNWQHSAVSGQELD